MSAGETATSRHPIPGMSRAYRFPPFERRILGNGIELVTAPVRKLPIVTVLALVDAGAACDRGELGGTARLTAKVMLEGTQRHDGATLVEQFEQLGATVDADPDWDGAVFSMTVLSVNLPPALSLLAEVLHTPRFDEREVSRLKEERLAELMQLRSEPRGLADEAFARFTYKPTSRYAYPEGGTPESVAAITVDEVKRFHVTRYVPTRSSIIVVGDVSHEDAELHVANALGNWQGPVGERAAGDDSPAETTRHTWLVEKAGAPQSELRIGHVGIPRNHPDYFPVVVMNAILGGLFSSRINLNLRETHGYTYGAYSRFEWRRQRGPFVVSTAVETAMTANAAKEIILEIERIRAAPVAEEELTLVTSYLDGVFPIQYETTAAIAKALSVLVRYGLPRDYFDSYRTNIRNVSREDVLQAARSHLHPESLQMVIVGDTTTVRDLIAPLNFGPISMHDWDG